MTQGDTIVALSTPPGVSALAVIRLSGPEAIEIVNRTFQGKDLTRQPTHTLHFGTIMDGEMPIDEVVVSLFIAPKSFTKEHVAEISSHGSPYIVQRLIKLMLKQGARLAEAGEFSRRAFLNGQFDLAQAEAIADLIHSDSEAAHKAAINQMRGGISQEIGKLREELIHFASMIELELDFAEEDVEFASREELKGLIDSLLEVIDPLVKSFDLGNVIKNGIPTVIAGRPNAGKSTLLNALVKEEKAIVSDIAGTTRDFIEDEIHIDGITFRFIDTAGLRMTEDKVEKIGVERTREKMKKASLILYMFDLANENPASIESQLAEIKSLHIPFVPIGNKIDRADSELQKEAESRGFILISAEKKQYLDILQQKLAEVVNLDSFRTNDTVVTNIRHHDQLVKTKESLEAVIHGIDMSVTNDFLAMDIRNALNALGEITGQITTDDLLKNIFSKFCIGK